MCAIITDNIIFLMFAFGELKKKIEEIIKRKMNGFS